ncbi:MAG: alpha/beta hydrolase [Gemmatimonadaceae bacterium]|nr:alpha/beta hydrolase [Gemmatimonadaceae bacterium]
MGAPPSQFRVVDGLDAHLRDEGPRDDTLPILLLHGTSSSLHTWEWWTADLSRSRRVITVDMPGFGLTGPDAHDDYRAARYTRFAAALLDSLRIARAIVGGNSFGGGVAWSLALDHPAKVAALILVDATGYPTPSVSVPIGFRLARNRVLAPLLRSILPRRIVRSSIENTYGDPARVTERQVERYEAITRRAGNRRALSIRFSQANYAARIDEVSRIHVPTLILWGDRDRLIPVESSERLHTAIAGSTLVRFPSLGHIPQEEDPAATLVPVRRFLGLP